MDLGKMSNEELEELRQEIGYEISNRHSGEDMNVCPDMWS